MLRDQLLREPRRVAHTLRNVTMYWPGIKSAEELTPNNAAVQSAMREQRRILNHRTRRRQRALQLLLLRGRASAARPAMTLSYSGILRHRNLPWRDVRQPSRHSPHATRRVRTEALLALRPRLSPSLPLSRTVPSGGAIVPINCWSSHWRRVCQCLVTERGHHGISPHQPP